MFLIDKSGNTEMRERADFAAKINARYERDFHHLQDVNSQASAVRLSLNFIF